MNLAILSVAALVVAVLVSCVSRINVGVLAIAMAWIVGVFIGGMPVNTIMAGFPSALFLTLTGVTLLFTLAQCNGTLEQVTRRAVGVCRGNRGAIPIMFFLTGAVLSSIGPGNIAAAALLVPLAMATATRTGIPLFLMAIMAGNGANAGGLSPFAPTGIIVNDLMARHGIGGYEVQTYLYNLLAHTTVAFGGYLLFGGLKLFGAGQVSTADAVGGDITALERRHWITLAVIAALIGSVLVLKVHVGMAAFAGAVILVLTGAGDDVEAVKRMPWRVIVMVCGVTVLISLVEKAQGIDLMVSFVAKIATPHTATFVVALLTGLVSVYSSTSGVVLPAFLPMVPGLAAALPGASALAIASSMNIGGHLVDVSPLSTIGALCLTGAADDNRTLFNQLLAWGLSMSIVGALLCYFVF